MEPTFDLFCTPIINGVSDSVFAQDAVVRRQTKTSRHVVEVEEALQKRQVLYSEKCGVL
jgi:hypothetical protein